jgi:hypothetical protein
MALSERHDSESWSALRNQRLAGPVREQPHRVLGKKRLLRLTPPRPSGRPFAATRAHADTRATDYTSRSIRDIVTWPVWVCRSPGLSNRGKAS